MLDMLKTGKYGVLANQQFLSTTSNNISNVNTTGYVRQDTQYYTSVIEWGIGESYTRRMYDQYVQRELYRDQASVNFYESYVSGMDSIDKMLTDDSMSISTCLNDYFDALQDAVQNPTSTASRRELLAELEVMTDRYQTLNYSITNQLHDVNSKIGDEVMEINDLVENIYIINKQIVGMSNQQSDIALQLQDKRDLLINQLSEHVDINVTVDTNGSYELYLSNGQVLMTSDVYAKISAETFIYDQNRLELKVAYSSNPAVKSGLTTAVGGSLGGLIQSTTEIRQTMRDLGQLALAFSDALNTQNKSGITLENKAGEDLITIKQPVAAVSSSANFAMNCTYIESLGENITACDYQVTFNSAGELSVYIVQNERNVLLTEGEDYVVETDPDTGALVLNMETHGIRLNFTGTEAAMAAEAQATGRVEFYVQPTMHAAYDIKMNATKPEDFAFASAVRTNTGTGNIGNAVISFEGMTLTSANMGVQINADGEPEFTAGAPVQIVIDDDGNYEVRDAAGNTLGTADKSCNGKNVFANTVWLDPALPEGYPGYEVSVTGTVSPRDTFNIELNFDGFSDNTNGIQMGLLQTASTVASSGRNKVSFTEGYSDLTASLGSALMSANNDLAASEAKCQQTEALYQSAAGVNLDEEAANLIRFQQSYTACSKIIAASQTVFDSLLSSF